jgi:hypothetical protein
MATRKHPSNQDNYQALYRKYFRGISPNPFAPLQPFDFKETDLKYLLQGYKLESHFPIFSRLASLASYYVQSWKDEDENRNVIDKIVNQEIDLINLAFELKEGRVSWIELRCNTGDKVKLSHVASVMELGETILESFNLLTEQKDLAKLTKRQKKKGKPHKMMPIQNLIFGILRYLDKETELNCNGKLITNEQTRFIFEFLQLSKVIEPNSTFDEEYIRTTLNNFKAKYPEFFISLFPKPLK